MSNALQQLGSSGLEQLANAIIPRLRIDVVAPVFYEITEVQYAKNEVSDPWVQKLLHMVDVNVTWLQPLLTTNNYDSLVHMIIDFVVKRLEVMMTQKCFNQLGGLQLDRDARTLVGHFSGMTQRTVCDKFARLTQIATILNVENVSKILEYWGKNSGPVTWRLSSTEVHRILSLYVDFKPESNCCPKVVGDLEHTHLVKGLDYALLHKIQSEIDKRPEDQEPLDDGKRSPEEGEDYFGEGFPSVLLKEFDETKETTFIVRAQVLRLCERIQKCMADTVKY